jgi:hypothetical protein
MRFIDLMFARRYGERKIRPPRSRYAESQNPAKHIVAQSENADAALSTSLRRWRCSPLSAIFCWSSAAFAAETGRFGLSV